MKAVHFCMVVLLAAFGTAFTQEDPIRCFPEVTVFDGRTMDLIGGSPGEVTKLKAFPLEKYEIYDVPALGSFYIDFKEDTIKGTLSSGTVWEPHIVELIKNYTREGTIAIDLGAHIGTHLVTMSQAVGENGYAI
jgi:hypothetical protein